MQRLIGAVLVVLGLAALPAIAQEVRVFEAGNGAVEIPAAPQRIVSLHDLSITLPLVELGATDRIVGSHGRVAEDGTPYIRAVNELYEVDYGNSDIEFVGVFDAIDLESIALLEPDLIIGRAGNDDALLANLQKIAPTILIDFNNVDYFERMRAVADAGGVLAEYDRRLAKFEALIAESQRLIPNAADISVSLIQPWPLEGYINGARTYYALSEVLDAIGFAKPDVIAELTTADGDFSPEFLPELDADFIISTYETTSSAQASPDLIRAGFEKLVPGYCAVLHACRSNQLIILPRSPIYSASFKSLETANQHILTHVAGRPFIPLAK